MKIAKEPDDGYTSGSLRQGQPAYEYNTSCSESAVLGGAQQKRFGVRTWHWQACQQCLALFVRPIGGRAGGMGECTINSAISQHCHDACGGRRNQASRQC